MKKLLFSIIWIVLALSSYSQETLQSVTNRGAVTTNNIKILKSGSDNIAQGGLFYLANDGIGSMNYATGMQLGGSGSFDVWVYNNDGDGWAYPRLRVTKNGNVGIGTTTPSEKLSVNGNIRAKEIKVETVNWPDYVFEDKYHPSSLTDLETYIRTNKHLPEIPSAKEAEENGVNLGEMNTKLLKKIEELTLYVINQNKQLAEISASNEALKQSNKALKERVQALENSW